MEKIIQSFKNLYLGDGILKKHLGILALLFIPALFCGIAGFIDKDMPKEVMIVIGVIVLIFALLCIVPCVFLNGLFISFVKDRLNSITGIPKIRTTTFIEGLKVLPLQIVWGLYLLVVLGCISLLFFIPLMSLFSQGSNPHTSLILLTIGGFLVFFLLTMLFCILICPFMNYIYIDYVNEGKLCRYLFNPLKIFDYMKKAFKETMLVFVKFWVVAIVGSLVSGIFQLLAVFFGFGIGVLAVLTTSEANSDVAIYTPIWATSLILLSSVVVLIHAYITTMIGYAAVENYIGVYKEKITE